MYLGIIFLSEMVNASGRILRKYIYGTETQQKTKYNYPTMRKPPSAAWGVLEGISMSKFRNRSIHSISTTSIQNGPTDKTIPK